MKRLGIACGLVLLCSCLAAQAALYEAILNSFEVMPGEIEGIVDYGTVRLTRKGRNTFSILGSFSVLQNIGDEAEIMWTAYKLDPFSDRRQKYGAGAGKLCQVIAGDELVYPQLLQVSDFPPKGTCPFPKGNYTIDEYVLDERSLPPFIPPGEWLVEIKMLRDGLLGGGYGVQFTVK
ncbi:uncharacterized protein LOC126581342 [Anopheles aquasalis]|uniref:uncharacterized protein LOC126581342 n=1 Tax=Anopheles aquasalis TaxID=42839 RepID=UPI00215AEF98|nr:uncharacterized protein LOC126581342 [Anopheles aquasalis]